MLSTIRSTILPNSSMSIRKSIASVHCLSPVSPGLPRKPRRDPGFIIGFPIWLTVAFVYSGGEEVLLDVGGQDATEAFEDVGHSDEARETLEKFYVGSVKRKVSRYFRASPDHPPISVVSACHSTWALTNAISAWRSHPQGYCLGRRSSRRYKRCRFGHCAVRLRLRRRSCRLLWLPIPAKPGSQGIREYRVPSFTIDYWNDWYSQGVKGKGSSKRRRMSDHAVYMVAICFFNPRIASTNF